MADEQKTPEQREKAWWDAWWEADFSWEGLARHWEGLTRYGIDSCGGLYDEQTLQDYWRRDPATGMLRDDDAMRAAGEVIEGPDRKLWHIVHLPPKWRDGAATWKANRANADWGKLDGLIDQRLRAGVDIKVDGKGGAEGVEGPALLRGAVLNHFSGHPDGRETTLHIDGRQSCVLGGCDCRSQAFASALFDSAHFEGIAWFDNARFEGTAGFDSASFAGHAWFNDASFVGDANFVGADFAGDAEFAGARFASDALVDSASFARDALFDNASFAGDARFDYANFVGDAGFAGASFAGEVRFYKTSFAGEAWFASASFAGDAGFGFATFQKDVWFIRLGLEGAQPATFEKEAAFDNGVFEGATRFGEARFRGRMNFDKARFLRIADFSAIEVPETEPDWRKAFDGVLFESSLDLRGVTDRAVSMVAGATFDRGVLLSRVSEDEERDAHRTALLLAQRAEQKDEALRELESGALKLKLAMEQASDLARAQRFYRLELRARRKRADTKWTEKLFSLLFAGTAGYGGSIGLPFVWLFGAIMTFALGFWAMEGGVRGLVEIRSAPVVAGAEQVGAVNAERPELAVRIDPSIVEATRYSLSRVFPLGSWDEGAEPVRVVVDQAEGGSEAKDESERRCTFRERLLAVGECRPGDRKDWPEGTTQLELHRLAVMGLSTLQTIFAGLLYFLLALAVRRRFQIS